MSGTCCSPTDLCEKSVCLQLPVASGAIEAAKAAAEERAAARAARAYEADAALLRQLRMALREVRPVFQHFTILISEQ